jgi:adenine-specific DNA-methyltransferase
MGVGITYMGTKRDLAPAVADVIGQAKAGTLLDAFAGMCSVAEAVGPARQIWTNDIQRFAAEIGAALFTSRDEPMSSIATSNLHFDFFSEQRARLENVFAPSLSMEDDMLQCNNFSQFSSINAKLNRSLCRAAALTKGRSFSLFTRTYSNTYFGVRQAIEIDAIVKAIRTSKHRGAITEDHYRWLVIALGRALLKASNSTGHFAQFLKPKGSSLHRYVSQRKKSLWTEWLFSIGELHSVGPLDWRLSNRSFNQDSLRLIPKLIQHQERPSVIYADPPYTDDQYSRYYHLFETLVRYDYPTTSGAGLYRPRRFSTPFSLRAKAPAAFESLIRSAAELGADLVLSYPTNGLVHAVGTDPEWLLKRYYRQVRCCYRLSHSHSTFGASKGPAQAEVTELIYLATS